MKKSRLSIVFLCLTMVLTLAGCGASSDTTYYGSSSDSVSSLNSSYDGLSFNSVAGAGTDSYSLEEGYYAENEYYEESLDTEKSTDVDNSTTSMNIYETKLIYRTDVEIETLEFDNSYTNLKELINKYGGFVENERFTNSGSSYLNDKVYSSGRAVVKRKVDILIRIPTNNYDAFNSENEAMGNLINKQSNVMNITQDYYDTTAQVESLEIQLSRLQEMMKNAVDYDDMISLNREITNVEYSLNQLKTQVRTMDMDVAYSYVNLTLKEVVEYSELVEIEKDTFANRFKNTVDNSFDSFTKFLENMLFAIIMLLPYLIIIIVVIVIIRIAFKNKLKERKELKKLERQALLSIFSKSKTVAKEEVVTEDKNKAEENKDESKE